MSKHDPILLAQAEFAELYPFHFGVDESLRFSQIGRSLSKIAPGAVVGADLLNVLELRRPHTVTHFGELVRLKGRLVVMRSRALRVDLRGQFLVDGGRRQILFVGSPWIPSLALLGDLRLTFQDFAPMDSAIESLQLVQSQTVAMEEARELSARMKIGRDELRESQNRLEMAIRGADCSLMEWDLRTDELEVRGRLPDMLGERQDRIRTNFSDWMDLVHPDDARRTLACFERCAAGGGEAMDIEYRLRRGAGDWIWILHRGAVGERDAEGVPLRVSGTLLNITPRKLAELNLREARKNEQEIEQEIEQGLLKGRTPLNVGWADIAAYGVSSGHLSGDFFEFQCYPGERADLVIGDVMGKGIHAALLGAGLKQNLLKSMCGLMAMRTDGELPPVPQLIARIQAELHPTLVQLEKFITLCYARFDMHRKQLNLVSCGHTKTIHFRRGDGRSHFLEGGNLPLGVAYEDVFEEVEVKLERGDILVFYSDGLIETGSSRGALFTEKRLADIVERYHSDTPRRLVDHIRRELDVFAGTRTLRDDLTLIIIAINPPGEGTRRELRLISGERNVARLRAFAAEILAGIEAEMAFGLTVAMVEIMTNIFAHALHGRPGEEVVITAERSPEALRVAYTYRGKAYDTRGLAAGSTQLLRDPGASQHGRGIFIVNCHMDEHTCEQIDPSTVRITLVKVLTPPSADATGRFF